MVYGQGVNTAAAHGFSTAALNLKLHDEYVN